MEAIVDNTSSKYIHRLQPNDVLLGRGRHVKHKGNGEFRALVQSRVVEYVTNRNKSIKEAIARDIVKSVRNSGGRFIKPLAPRKVVDSEDEMIQVWEIADESTVLLKVKQTIRDYSVVARRAAAAAESESTSSTTGTYSTRPTENGTTQPSNTNVSSTASALHTTFRHSSNDQPARNFPVRDSHPPFPAETGNIRASSSTIRQRIDDFNLLDIQSFNLLLQQQGLEPRTLQYPAPLSCPESLIPVLDAAAMSPSSPSVVATSVAVPHLTEALIRNQVAQQIAGQNRHPDSSSTRPIESIHLHPSADFHAITNFHLNFHNADGHH